MNNELTVLEEPQIEASKEVEVTTENQAVGSSNVVDISTFESIPDLDELEVQDVNLSIDYWTPEAEGETRRAVYKCIELRNVEEETGESKELPTAIFYTKIDGQVVTFANASKRLVGIFEKGKLPSGFLCQIIYMGKEKNATNSFKSDRWKVNPLKK